LLEHARYALSLQVPEAIVVENGDLLRLAPGPAEVIDHVHSGRLLLDGKRLLSTESEVIRARRRLMNNGVAFVTLVIDGDGALMAEPRIVAQGVFDPDDPDKEGETVLIDAVEAVRTALAALPRHARDNDEAIGEAARIAARRVLKPERDKRPVVEVQVVRI
jgi:ribonuclease J